MNIRDWPIKRKFNVGTLIITLPAILFISLFLIIAEQRTTRATLLSNTQASVGMVAKNSVAALLYDDPAVAQQILSSVSAEPNVAAAALFDADGKLYAWFPTNLSAASLPLSAERTKTTYLATSLDAFEDVMNNDAYAGSAFLRVDLSSQQERFRLYVITVSVVAAVAILISLLMSKLLQKWITTPLTDLAQTSQTIATQGDFSLRAKKQSGDEIGQLVDAFNQMLNEIQQGQRKVESELIERRRVESALRKSEESFRSMADNIAALAWMANPDGFIFFYNKRWYEYSGTTYEQMQGWGWESVHHPDHLQRMLPIWKGALAQGEPWEDTFPLRGKDGNYRWFLSRAFPIRDESGQITRWFGTNTDITELLETQQALNKAQAELRAYAANLEQKVQERTADLKETNDQLESFVYSIAHDLRGPLRAMQGFSQLLLEDHASGLADSGKHFLKRINASSEFMDAMILDLLAFGRVSRSEIQLETVDVHAAWSAALFQCASEIEQSKTVIEVVSTLPSIRAHESTLAQVLANLLSNSIKFVAKGVVPHIQLGSEEAGPVVRLWLQDNGIGIPEDQYDRVFRVFERMHGAQYPGTGIGLSIVRKSLERMGGKVWIESEVGKGTRFWIELPKA